MLPCHQAARNARRSTLGVVASADGLSSVVVCVFITVSCLWVGERGVCVVVDEGFGCSGRCRGQSVSRPKRAAAQPATSSRDATSPIMMLGAFVLADGIVGMPE